MTARIEPIEIQRLVDGRMPTDERAMLLEWAGEHPENWQSIATAFIEHQALTDALEDHTDGADARPSSQREQTMHKKPIPWLLTACGLLLAVSVSANVWAIASQRDRGDIVAASPDDDTRSDSPVQPTYVLWVPDPPAARSVPRDRTHTSTLDEAIALLSTPIIEDEARQLFADVGFEPIEEPNLYLVEDDAGRGYVVPQRRVTLRPVSHTDSP